MKFITVLMVTLIGTSVFANSVRPEPTGRKRAKRGFEMTKSLKEATNELNVTARNVLGKALPENYKIELPKDLTLNQMNRYENDIRALNEALLSKKTELQDPQRATETSSGLVMLNRTYKALPSCNEFYRANSKNLTKEEAQVTANVIRLIHKFMTLDIVKINETAETPVSNEQILRVKQIVVKNVKKTGMKIEDFMKIEREVTSILPENYTMAKAARCRR